VGARVAVVLTDPPGVVRPDDGRLRRALRSVDISIVTRGLRRADAVVVLAAPLGEDFAPGVPALVVEGLVDPGSPYPPSTRVAAHSRRVVFAGGLHEEYGVARLVEAFRALPEDVELQLFGRGPLGAWLEEQARQDPRIQPPRLVSLEELPEVYGGAGVLVQPRQVDQDFVRYSFPSKLIEYLASGTPTVSTRLPSIPADYEPYIVWSDSAEPADLAAAITRVLEWTEVERTEFGRRAAGFIRESRGAAAQGRRIVDFLTALDVR
jgi:glycosyltransferase involved in cell wall biosynthesis